MSRRRRKTALILNSRQQKHPRGSDSWVRNTTKAVEFAAGEGYSIVSSVGMNTWELVTYHASRQEAELLLLIPKDVVDPDDLIFDFNLDAERVEFCEVGCKTTIGKKWWHARDLMALDLADLVIPVSIRPGGDLEGMIASSEKETNRDFAVEYDSGSRPLYEPVNPERIIIDERDDWEYITHWTRSFDSPWPDQRPYDYYEMVASGGSHYSHSALNTLLHIVSTGRLAGSSRRIKGGFEVVAFTKKHPAVAVELMKWRARFVRWNFEPYGIAIETGTALQLGMRPVVYGTHDDYDMLDDSDKSFYQNVGEKGGDWEPESEWRHAGVLDLNLVPPDRLRIIVRRKSELKVVREVTPIEVIALTDE